MISASSGWLVPRGNITSAVVRTTSKYLLYTARTSYPKKFSVLQMQAWFCVKLLRVSAFHEDAAASAMDTEQENWSKVGKEKKNKGSQIRTSVNSCPSKERHRSVLALVDRVRKKKKEKKGKRKKVSN